MAQPRAQSSIWDGHGDRGRHEGGGGDGFDSHRRNTLEIVGACGWPMAQERGVKARRVPYSHEVCLAVGEALRYRTHEATRIGRVFDRGIAPEPAQQAIAQGPADRFAQEELVAVD